MEPNDLEVNLADLVDGTLSGAEWDAWLAAHPEAAAEVAIGRRVRSLLRELNAASIGVPADFEERLAARIRQDRTLLALLDLGLAGLGRALIELINALLGLLPAPAPQPSVA
jgi:anti-sigma factor RsiW